MLSDNQCKGVLPATRPFKFAETEIHGKKVWMLCTNQGKGSDGAVTGFHRYQICKELYSTDELNAIHIAAIYQNEPIQLLAWIRNAIQDSQN